MNDKKPAGGHTKDDDDRLAKTHRQDIKTSPNAPATPAIPLIPAALIVSSILPFIDTRKGFFDAAISNKEVYALVKTSIRNRSLLPPWPSKASLTFPEFSKCMDISSDGSYLVCGGPTGTLLVWDVCENGAAHNLYELPFAVGSVCFSRQRLNGSPSNSNSGSGSGTQPHVLVSLDSDSTIRFWSMADYSCIRAVQHPQRHKRRFGPVAFLNEPNRTQQQRHPTAGCTHAAAHRSHSHSEQVYSIVYVVDRSLFRWDVHVATGVEEPKDTLPTELHVQDGDFSHVSVSPRDGETIALENGEKGGIQLLDADGTEILLEDHNKFYTHVWFSPDGTMLMGVCKDNTMRLWDVSYHDDANDGDDGDDGDAADDMTVAQHDRRVGANGGNGQMEQYDAETRKVDSERANRHQVTLRRRSDLSAHDSDSQTDRLCAVDQAGISAIIFSSCSTVVYAFYVMGDSIYRWPVRRHANAPAARVSTDAETYEARIHPSGRTMFYSEWVWYKADHRLVISDVDHLRWNG